MFLHSIEFSVIGVSHWNTATIVRIHGAKVRVEVSDEIRRSSRLLSKMQIEVV